MARGRRSRQIRPQYSTLACRADRERDPAARRTDPGRPGPRRARPVDPRDRRERRRVEERRPAHPRARWWTPGWPCRTRRRAATASGPRTLVLGTAYQRRIDLRSVALPHMVAPARPHRRDRRAVGRVGDELLHIEQVESALGAAPLVRDRPHPAAVVRRAEPAVPRGPARRRGARDPPAPPSRRRGPRGPADGRGDGTPPCRSRANAASRLAYGETIAGVNTVAGRARAAPTGASRRPSRSPAPRPGWDAAAIERWTPQLLETTATVSDRLGHRR